MFRKIKGYMKGKCDVFRDYIQRNNVCMVDLESKLKEGTYGWSIFKLKCQKTVEKTDSQKRK